MIPWHLLSAEEARERRDLGLFRLALTGVFAVVAAPFVIALCFYIFGGAR